MGVVAPNPAPALSAGPLPYPVMLGSDPGVGFLSHFILNCNHMHRLFFFRLILSCYLKQWSGVNTVLLMANPIILT